VSKVLDVDVQDFKRLAGELVRRTQVAPLISHAYELGLADITLVRTDSGRLDYDDYDVVYRVSHKIPNCKEGYIEVEFNEVTHGYDFSMNVCIDCDGGRYFSCAHAALVKNDVDADEVVTKPLLVYDLYRFLKHEGVGAKPLLEIAALAEEEGDGEIADALRKLYTLLVSLERVAAGMKQVDYSSAETEAEDVEVVRGVGRAVELLREARRAAERGNTALLDRLYETAVVATPGLTVEDETEPWRVFRVDEISLRDIVEYLISPSSGYSEYVKALLDHDPEDLARETSIYRAILDAARVLGLDKKAGVVE